jgi:hypothetical protein
MTCTAESLTPLCSDANFEKNFSGVIDCAVTKIGDYKIDFLGE